MEVESSINKSPTPLMISIDWECPCPTGTVVGDGDKAVFGTRVGSNSKGAGGLLARMGGSGRRSGGRGNTTGEGEVSRLLVSEGEVETLFVLVMVEERRDTVGETEEKRPIEVDELEEGVGFSFPGGKGKPVLRMDDDGVPLEVKLRDSVGVPLESLGLLVCDVLVLSLVDGDDVPLKEPLAVRLTVEKGEIVGVLLMDPLPVGEGVILKENEDVPLIDGLWLPENEGDSLRLREGELVLLSLDEALPLIEFELVLLMEEVRVLLGVGLRESLSRREALALPVDVVVIVTLEDILMLPVGLVVWLPVDEGVPVPLSEELGVGLEELVGDIVPERVVVPLRDELSLPVGLAL